MQTKFACFVPLVLSLSFILTGCLKTTEESVPEVIPGANLPTWSFLARVSSAFAEDLERVPKYAYVFPPIRVNSSGQPIDVLTHRFDERGGLIWDSPAPRAGEIREVVQMKLASKGFKMVSFQEVTNSPKAHSILVFNPYFSETQPVNQGDIQSGYGWTVFVRITAATFGLDLDPAKKRDVMNQELVTLFKHKESADSVVKRSLQFLLDYMGKNEQWEETISLIN